MGFLRTRTQRFFHKHIQNPIATPPFTSRDYPHGRGFGGVATTPTKELPIIVCCFFSGTAPTCSHFTNTVVQFVTGFRKRGLTTNNFILKYGLFKYRMHNFTKKTFFGSKYSPLPCGKTPFSYSLSQILSAFLSLSLSLSLGYSILFGHFFHLKVLHYGNFTGTKKRVVKQ